MDVIFSRRLAHLNDTTYMYEKGLVYWAKLIKAATKAKSFSKLPKRYKTDITNAEKELK